jgi:tetratricopeptide (TPR) repeat protein
MTSIQTNTDIPQQMRLGGSPDRLDSWKEIASYLKREVRTVQLWEKKEGLPVHRHFHTHLGTVFAFRSEIEAWGKLQAERRLAIPTEETHRPTRIAVAPLQHACPHSSAIVAATITALESPGHSSLELLTNDSQPDFHLTWECSAAPFTLKASLLRHNSQSVVWSRTFHTDPANTPQAVADQIVQCLWLKILSISRLTPTLSQIEKADSREAYLKGRYFWNRRDRDSMRKAIGWFRKAIDQDPTFALPYSGLADSLTLLSFYEIVSPADAMPEARVAALRAIDLDPNLAEAHASLADIHLHFDRDWEGADREYRRAIHCNPGYALSYHWYANLLAAKGQHEAAQIAIMHALEIDPVSLITQVWAGVTAHLAHRFDEAIQHYQSALELDPNFTWAHMYMAQTLEQKGQYTEALREFDTAIHLAGGSRCVSAMKAHTHAMAGDQHTARTILRSLTSSPDRNCMPSYDIAAAYTALGAPRQAVSWLQRACRERNMKLFKLRQDPRFDSLRHRPEFAAIMEHVGLARYSALELH